MMYLKYNNLLTLSKQMPNYFSETFRADFPYWPLKHKWLMF